MLTLMNYYLFLAFWDNAYVIVYPSVFVKVSYNLDGYIAKNMFLLKTKS